MKRTKQRKYTHDVFLSHSNKDKPSVEQLAERLKADGLKVWFDKWVIKPGDSIPLAIEKGLESTRTMILLMTGNSVGKKGSDWVTLERHTTLFRDPVNKERRFVPVLLEETRIPESLQLFAYVDWRERDEDGYQQILGACPRDPLSPLPAMPFSRTDVEKDGFPFEYGSDLHWFWGWGYKIQLMIDEDKEPSTYDWMIFRPCRAARAAMMRYSVHYPLLIKAVDECLDSAESQFERFKAARTEDSGTDFYQTLDALAYRIRIAAQTIGEVTRQL